MAIDLPPRLQKLYDSLSDQYDVSIADLHKHLFGEDVPLRHAQQRLGTPITRLNRRLAKHKKRVVPGRLKGTYRLTSVG
jgi:hypothetical protein